MRTGYRLHRRLGLCQSVLRAQLCARAPPPREKKCAGSSLLQTFQHLQESCGTTNASRNFQREFQKDFLALK